MRSRRLRPCGRAARQRRQGRFPITARPTRRVALDGLRRTGSQAGELVLGCLFSGWRGQIPSACHAGCHSICGAWPALSCIADEWSGESGHRGGRQSSCFAAAWGRSGLGAGRAPEVTHPPVLGRLLEQRAGLCGVHWRSGQRPGASQIPAQRQLHGPKRMAAPSHSGRGGLSLA